jgi:choline transport protein
MVDLDQEQIELGEKTAQQIFEQSQGTILSVVEGEEVNASGYRDQLARQYGIWSICGLALTIDNAWIALGGSLTVAIGRATITTLAVS